MTDEEHQDDELLLEDVVDEEDQPETDEGDDDAGEGHEDDAGEAEGFEVEIDGYEPDEAEETPAIRKLRQELRETQRKLHRYETAPQPQKIEVGEEPTLEGCDWDEDAFKAKWREWNGRKVEADRQNRDAEEQQRAAQERFVASYTTYRQHAAKLNVSDYDDVEKHVAEALPLPLQNAIPEYFGDKGPLTVLALGRHPKLLAEIVDMKDPVAQLLRLKEISMGVKPKMGRKAPAPERGTIPQGSAVGAAGVDKTLERLEKEADKTGDRSKLIDYKRKMAQK